MAMSEVTIIRPKDKFHWRDLYKLWEYRELLYFLTWRDLKVRYKQTVVGVAWVIFQPFMSMVVFSVIFGNLAHIPTDPDMNGNAVPYPIFVFVGLLFWQFFSLALSDISVTLLNNQHIINKVYFPRILLPISTILTRLVDFGVSFLVLIGLMVYYKFLPNIFSGLLILPFLIIVSSFACLGLGLLFAAINVKFRDVRYVLPYFIQIMLFVTPVVYSTTIVGYDKAWIFSLNPMASVIKLARSAFLGVFAINWTQLGISLSACLVLLAVGWIYFRKIEKESVDLM